MHGTFLFLGTGASSGVPKIGCGCAVCRSTDSRNQRLRPSGVIEVAGKRLLLDVGPDFRQQMLRAGLDHLDGMLLTHTHYDHIAGIDELRALNFKLQGPFPTLLSKESLADLHVRYSYMFTKGVSVTASLDCTVLPDEAGEVEFLGIKVGYISYRQGNMKVNGYRIGNFAYVTDIREFGEDIYPFLKGVDQLVLSALRPDSSKLHLSLDEAVEIARKAGVGQTWLTHLSHEIDHEAVMKRLPANVQPGYDGQQLKFEMV